MSNQRYTPEFKDEAARQIVDRGYSVVDVSERLGVSAHSLYKWVICRSSFYPESRRLSGRSRAQSGRAEDTDAVIKAASASSSTSGIKNTFRRSTWHNPLVRKYVCNCRHGCGQNGLNKGLQANVGFSPPPPLVVVFQ